MSAHLRPRLRFLRAFKGMLVAVDTRRRSLPLLGGGLTRIQSACLLLMEVIKM